MVAIVDFCLQWLGGVGPCESCRSCKLCIGFVGRGGLCTGSVGRWAGIGGLICLGGC